MTLATETVPETLTTRDLDLFDLFGFVRARGPLSPSVVAALEAELDSEMTLALGDTTRAPEGDIGRAVHMVPLMTPRTPTSVDLVDRFAVLAEWLVGRPILPSYAEASVFFGPTPWHLDNGNPMRAVKFIVYLDPLDGPEGALLFLPGSHHADYRQLVKPFLDSFHVKDDEGVRETIDSAPAHALPSLPGDLLVIDEHVWHCAAVTPPRRQWGITFVPAPRTPLESDLVRRFFRFEFQAASVRGYDGAQHPFHDPDWLRSHPAWSRGLEEVGALEAAAAAAAS